MILQSTWSKKVQRKRTKTSERPQSVQLGQTGLIWSRWNNNNIGRRRRDLSFSAIFGFQMRTDKTTFPSNKANNELELEEVNLSITKHPTPCHGQQPRSLCAKTPLYSDGDFYLPCFEMTRSRWRDLDDSLFAARRTDSFGWDFCWLCDERKRAFRTTFNHVFDVIY